MKFPLIILLFVILFAPAKVNADISLLIHEATGYSGEMTGAGHVTVYLSNVCTDPPLVLRQCRVGEPKGVVVATYPEFGPNSDYKWFAMPVLQYLYAVDSEQQIPLYANGKIRSFLRETSRVKYLSKIVPRSSETGLPPGRWSGVLGAAMNRDLYAFTVKTTPEQDLRFLEKYSTSPKGNDFNIMFNNCADFTRGIVNFYFPKSASRDFINDFGMTTPKALARSFKGYAAKRPDLLFYITKYPQIDGTILRSSSIRNFTETAFTSKKYVITQLLTKPSLLAIFAGTYFLTGYFDVDSAYRSYPSAAAARLNLEKNNLKQSASAENEKILADIKARQKTEKERVFGEKRGWEIYRLAFYPMLEKAVKERLFADKNEVKSFFGDLEQQSTPFYDERGDLMLRVNNYGQEATLGLTRRNILGANSDTRLAYKLMLAKVKYELEASEKDRETMETFQENWQMLMELLRRSAALEPVQLPANARFLTTPVKKSTSSKMLELFRTITH
ncbi:MAG: hypothetical protein ACR2GD_08145 [Pyrinomonadaceae bacterium]